MYNIRHYRSEYNRLIKNSSVLNEIANYICEIPHLLCQTGPSCARGLGGCGPIRAALTEWFSNHQLRWMFVDCLILLAALAIVRGSRSKDAPDHGNGDGSAGWGRLALIGLIGSVSSGLLGIGCSLAITALPILLLYMGQHRVQVLSLIITALPLILPAAWMYVHQSCICRGGQSSKPRRTGFGSWSVAGR